MCDKADLKKESTLSFVKMTPKMRCLRRYGVFYKTFTGKLRVDSFLNLLYHTFEFCVSDWGSNRVKKSPLRCVIKQI